MQKRSIKNHLQAVKIIVLMILGTVIYMNKAMAQTSQEQYADYLKEIKPIMDYPTLSYRYTLSLIEASTGKEMEEMNGMLLKSGNHFLDSNSHTVTLSNEGYIFKANNDDKMAIVYSIKALQKNFDGKTLTSANQVFTIPDSLLLKEGKFLDVSSSSEMLDFKYVLNKGTSDLKEMYFKIAKEKMVLIEVVLVLRENNKFNRVFRLYDFNSLFDIKRMEVSNYFNISGTRVTLFNRFRSFKVKTLL